MGKKTVTYWVEIAANTRALAVPGGAIVKYQEYGGNLDSPEGEYPSISMVFVPGVSIVEVIDITGYSWRLEAK